MEIPNLNPLTLDQRIGQTLCFGWQGATDAESRTINSHARALIEEMQVGSIVLLGRNISPPEELRATLAELQQLSPIPLLVAVDQEGGRVNRIPEPFHQFPGNMALGAISQGGEELARRQAEAQARELRAVGINWNFAPVCDVNSNPDNPIIGVRAFGDDPQLVARLASAMVRGYQEAGILATAKHFPGHGDTDVDSHLALPTIRGDRARLDAVELVPFRAAIAAGVGSIMTTHILFPALDSERPATMSPAILSGLLRSELGYDGLVVTDCLEMKAIADTAGTPRGAVEALKAGADVVLVCHTLETQRETVAAIRSAVRSGDIPEERINSATARVLAAKARTVNPLSPPDTAPWDDPEINALEAEIVRGKLKA